MIWFLLIICVVSGARSAPTKVNTLYSAVINDNRTENLRKHPFVAECKEPGDFSKSLCFAMYDVALSFYAQKLEFASVDVTFEDGGFCEALQQVLPEAPANNESSIAFKGSAQWFKDTLKNDNEEDVCSHNCFYRDRSTYENKLLPVCRFLLNQYSLLLNQSSTQTTIQVVNTVPPKLNETNSNETDLTISAETQAQIVPAAGPILTNVSNNTNSSSATVVPSNVNSTKTSTNPQKSTTEVLKEIAMPTNVTLPQVSTANEKKTEVVTKKAETTKSVPTKLEVDIKSEEGTKVDDTKDDTKDDTLNVNLDGTDDNDNLFDNDGGALENVDKDADPKVEFPYNDDEEEEYHDDPMARNNNKAAEVKIPQEVEPTVEEEVPHKKLEYVDFQEDPESNFFTYLCGLMFLCIVLYILHQNRHKILALFLEGRRGNRRNRERSRSGSKAAYSKLDCNLEEAITSKKSLSGKSMDIIY